MGTKGRVIGLAAAALLLHTALASAHHSFSAEYDAKKPATLTGVVSRIEWTNPHVRFFMNVSDPSGTTTAWEFTMGAVNGLIRRGWTRSMIKAGDTVTVDAGTGGLRFEKHESVQA